MRDYKKNRIGVENVMDSSMHCIYNGGMDLCRYLSDKSHYMELRKAGEKELRRRAFHDRDEIDDIISAALERLLDYFQRRPDKFLQIEEKPQEEMSNYLKKALRNHILNIISRQSRLQRMHNRLVQDPFMLILHDIQTQSHPGGSTSNVDGNPDSESWRGLSWEQIREEIHYFIEEKFGRAKWAAKKAVADFFLQRLREGLSLREMQARYPDRNTATMNTEGHRLIRSFRQWVARYQRRPVSIRCKHDQDDYGTE